MDVLDIPFKDEKCIGWESRKYLRQTTSLPGSGFPEKCSSPPWLAHDPAVVLKE